MGSKILVALATAAIGYGVKYAAAGISALVKKLKHKK